MTTPDWILENLNGTIIYKDFNMGDLNFVPLRTLNKKIRPHFNVREFKNEIYLPSRESKTTTEKVLSILLNSNVRRGSASVIKQHIPTFKENINRLIQNSQPITLVLPAMPHKKQNPITTGHSIDFIDLGEYACFQQLKNIINSIAQVYTQGAKVILVPDGIVLAHLFAKNNTEGVISYRNKLNKVLEQFELRNLIEIVDLQDLTSNDQNFSIIKEEIKRQLFVLELTNKNVQKGLNILQKAMLFNIPFSHSMNDYISLMKLPIDKMPDNIVNQLRFAAFDYVSILLALKKLDLIKNTFPHAIRLSVHCKNTPNIPVNLINDTTQIFPYNGIPVIRMQKYTRNQNIRASTRVMRLYEIYKYPSAVAVYIEGQKEPFYYEIESLQES